MIEVLAALLICAGTAMALRGGWDVTQLPRFDSKVLFLAILSIVAAVMIFGPVFGTMVIVAVVIHEMGHVMAYRVCGHSDARFRLIPLFGGVAISNNAPRTQTHDFYITLLGPAIGLGPMALAFALSITLRADFPFVASMMAAFGMTTAALNAFNLMPFYPLDGGRILRLATASLWPAAEMVAAGLMVGLLLIFAVLAKSFLIGIIAVIGFQALRTEGGRKRVAPVMEKATALAALAAYGFTLAAFIVGGLPLLRAIL